MREQTANLCTTDACESLRARLAKYEDVEGRPVVAGDCAGLIGGLRELSHHLFNHEHRLIVAAADALEDQAREIERHAEVVRVESSLRASAEQELAALKAHPSGVVLPGENAVMRLVLREMGNSRHVRGTSNWCADVGMAVVREVARLNSSHVSLTQCDGCRAGIPLENGMHAMGIPGGYADKMMCTWSHYESAPSHGEQVRADAERFNKLLGWMSSNVADGWNEVCRVSAVATYVSHDEARAYLDDLPQCSVGLAAAPSPSREGK